MAYAVLKRSSMAAGSGWMRREFASVSVETGLLSAAPSVSLQKARRWEGLSSTPLPDIFKGKKVIFGLPGVDMCTSLHVSSYMNNINKFKAKGIDSAICVSVNPPYGMDGLADKLQAKEAASYSLMSFNAQVNFCPISRVWAQEVCDRGGTYSKNSF